jgi:hypothetical protein
MQWQRPRQRSGPGHDDQRPRIVPVQQEARRRSLRRIRDLDLDVRAASGQFRQGRPGSRDRDHRLAGVPERPRDPAPKPAAGPDHDRCTQVTHR